MNIAAIAATGIKWFSLAQVGRQIIQYITTVILATLLIPDDFGLIAMSIVVIGFLDIFKDLGTSSAIIYLKELSSELLASIFWVNILFGVCITLIIFFSAPLIADFYSNPKIEDILKLLSFSFVISGAAIVQKALLEKEFEFEKLAVIELISVLLGAVIGIILAFTGFGVWSLVIQLLSSTTILTFLLWFMGSWTLSFKFSYHQLKEVIKYSSNLLGYNIFNYFVRNVDYLLIGKFIGENVLGHYYLVYKIMLYPVQNISQLVSRVMFPVYSKIRDDNVRFSKIFASVASAIAFITFPLMSGLFALSDIFSKVFLSANWDFELFTSLLMILAPIGLLQSVITTTGSIYQAKGKTDWMFKWGLVSGVIVIIGFIIGLNWGVIGVALSYLITTLLLLYPVFSIPFRLINLQFNLFVKDLIKILILSLIMISIIYLNLIFFKDLLTTEYILILLIIIGAFTYFLLNYLFNYEQLMNIRNIFHLSKN